MTNRCLYHAWLRHAFASEARSLGDDHAVVRLATPLEWVHVFKTTLQRCGEDLAAFSDDQVACGLRVMFDHAEDPMVFALKDVAVPLAERVSALRAIEILYRNCIAKRLPNGRAHNEPLAFIVFMLWDISPLGWWEGDPCGREMKRELVDLCRNVLEIDNDAARMSVLHALGHLAHYEREACAAVVDEFLDKHPNIDGKLRRYALEARDARTE